MKLTLQIAAVAAIFFGTQTTWAHVVLDEPVAMAGASYRASLRISHACEKSPTTTIKVFIPEGFRGAKPLPKAGWKLEVKTAPLANPYMSHGKQITQDVTEITWTVASADYWLPNEFFEEFVLRGSLLTDKAVLWFKVLQSCEVGQLDWSQTPASGTSTKGLATPAALLEIIPSTQVGHQH